MARERKRKRPIRDAAEEAGEAAKEAAETADAAEKSIELLTPEIVAAVEQVELAAIQAAATLKWIRTIKGWHRVFHWGNLFKPGKPFTTVELIFEEV